MLISAILISFLKRSFPSGVLSGKASFTVNFMRLYYVPSGVLPVVSIR